MADKTHPKPPHRFASEPKKGEGLSELLARLADTLSRLPAAMAGPMLNGMARQAAADDAGGDADGDAGGVHAPGPSADSGAAGLDRSWKAIMPLWRRVLDRQDRQAQQATTAPARDTAADDAKRASLNRFPADFGLGAAWDDIGRKKFPGGDRFGGFAADAPAWRSRNERAWDDAAAGRDGPVHPPTAAPKAKIKQGPEGPGGGFGRVSGLGTGPMPWRDFARGLANTVGVALFSGAGDQFTGSAARARWAAAKDRARDAAFSAHGQARYYAGRAGRGVAGFFLNAYEAPGRIAAAIPRWKASARNAAYRAHGHARYHGGRLARGAGSAWAAGSAFARAVGLGFALHRGRQPGQHRGRWQAAARRAAGMTWSRASRAGGAAGALTKAGLSLGMAAGLLTKAATPIGLASSAGRAAVDFAESRNDSNRRLAGYNGAIAQGFGNLAVGDFRRSIELGRATQESAVRLTAGVDRMRDSFQAWDKLASGVGNRAGIAGATLVGGVMDRLNPAISGLTSMLDRIDPGGKRTEALLEAILDALLGKKPGTIGGILGGAIAGAIGPNPRLQHQGPFLPPKPVTPFQPFRRP